MPTRMTETPDRDGLRMFGSPRAALRKEDHNATPNRSSGATLRALVQPKRACPRHRVWATVGRDGAPIPTQRGTGGWLADAYSGAAAAPQGERGPRGSPVVRTREPRHLRLPKRPRHSTTARSNGSNHAPTARPGRQPRTHNGVGTRAPPFTRMDGQRPPEHRRAPRPTCYRVWTAEAVLVVVPARPYSVPVQRLGVATRRWLGSSTALCVNFPLNRGFGS